MNANTTYIASVVAAYWFVSISMVYLNKFLMSGESNSIDAPLFVTWFQCVVTCLICKIAGYMGESTRNSLPMYSAVSGEEGGGVSGLDGNKSFWSQFPKAEYVSAVGKKVLPLSFIFVGMISFNNLTLKWVEVSFYNVARSMTIVFNVMFTYFVLKAGTSQRTAACLLIVIFGFFIGSAGELNFSLHGSIAGVMSSAFVSLNSIFTKKILPEVDDDHWKLTYYNNCNACVLFLPLMYFFEFDVLFESFSGGTFSSLAFWGAMVLAGVFGFSIGIVTVLQIKATSPLTHNISGTAKAAVQSVMAFYIWKNTPTVKGILGIIFVLGGSLLYTYVKMTEPKVQPKEIETR